MDNELLEGYKRQRTLWIEKINFFREEKIIAYDAGKKFGLGKEIEGIEKEIKRIDEILTNNPSNISESEIASMSQKIRNSRDELEKSLKINCLLSAKVGKIDENYFLGRENEIQEIRTRLSKNKHLTLINGEGGIGKTTLATKYWEDYEKHYKHLAWFFCGNGIIETLKTNLANATSLDLKETLEEYQITKLVTHLNNLEKDCLLILDNANDAEELDRFLHEFAGLEWHILITSRCENVAENEEFYINHLPVELAKTLFKRNYDEQTEEFELLLDIFLESIGYNTLCIEIFSKTLKSRKSLTMNDLIEILEEKGLFLGKKSKKIHNINWNTNTKKHDANTSDLIIKALYDISQLDKNESKLLNQFAVLPAQNHDFNILVELFQPQDEDDFEDQLDNLNQKGWISSSENGYRISPVVQKILLSQDKDILFEDCELILTNLELLYEAIRNDRIEGFWLVSFIEHIINVLPINYRTTRLQGNLVNILLESGFLIEAEYHQNASLKKVANKSYPELIPYFFNNFGNINRRKGNYKDAEQWYKMAERNIENANIENKNDVWQEIASVVYHNLHIIYGIMGNDDLSKSYFLKGKELSPVEDLAIILTEIDFLEKDGKSFDALAKILETIDSLEQKDENRTNTNLARLYIRAVQIEGKGSLSVEYSIMCLELAEQIFLKHMEKNPKLKYPHSLENLYNQYSLTYEIAKQYEKALEYAEKAKEVVMYRGKNDPNYEIMDRIVLRLKEKIKKSKFNNIRYNDPCICGSGLKYKKCCLKNKKN